MLLQWHGLSVQHVQHRVCISNDALRLCTQQELQQPQGSSGVHVGAAGVHAHLLKQKCLLRRGPGAPGGAACWLLVLLVALAVAVAHAVASAAAVTFLLQDNSTYVHVLQWSDESTVAVSVGLLLDVGGASPSVLAGSQPAPGHNFMLAVDSTTLLSVMQFGAAVRTPTPFLMYLSSNISFSSALLKVQVLPVNRPLLLVGLSTDNTSIDFGMEVNTLQLGPLGSITLNQVILENLAPGDARSAELAGPYEVSMTYYLWPVAFDR